MLLLLDHAYIEYVDPAEDDGGMALAAAHDNVLVTRTFSKIYGLAGERVGWGDRRAAADRSAQPAARSPFNVSLSGQAATVPPLADQAFVADFARGIIRTCDRGSSRRSRPLGNRGIRVLPSETNFVLVLFDGALTAQAA